jgi:uncharacterized membrane-anchored protein
MITATRALIVAGALLVLGAVNASIAGKELVIRDGEVVFLDLGPRDPRSLMQGDYMALRFRIADQLPAGAKEGERRVARIALDDKRIASLAPQGAASTLPLRYRMRNGAAWIGTNAFFFQEGSEQRYARARYGEFRVDRESGEAVLVGLRDAALKPL